MLMSTLQLLCNPVTQLDDAKDGFEYILDLLVRCRVTEVTYNLSSASTSQRCIPIPSECAKLLRLAGNYQARTLHV
jgi:hypothetical protein